MVNICSVPVVGLYLSIHQDCPSIQIRPFIHPHPSFDPDTHSVCNCYSETGSVHSNVPHLLVLIYFSAPHHVHSSVSTHLHQMWETPPCHYSRTSIVFVSRCVLCWSSTWTLWSPIQSTMLHTMWPRWRFTFNAVCPWNNVEESSGCWTSGCKYVFIDLQFNNSDCMTS